MRLIFVNSVVSLIRIEGRAVSARHGRNEPVNEGGNILGIGYVASPLLQVRDRNGIAPSTEPLLVVFAQLVTQGF